MLATLKKIYGFHFQNERRERLFLASLGFLVTFGIVRGITHLIKAGVGPFHNVVTSGGLHIHHLVWGFLLLLLRYQRRFLRNLMLANQLPDKKASKREQNRERGNSARCCLTSSTLLLLPQNRHVNIRNAKETGNQRKYLVVQIRASRGRHQAPAECTEVHDIDPRMLLLQGPR